MVTATSLTAAKIMLLNPIAQAIQDARFLLITNETTTTWSLVGEGTFVIKLIPIIITVVILIWGAMYFKKKSKFFAEEV